MAEKKSIKLGNVSPLKFLREVRTELTKVTWPTRNSTIKLTTVVIGVSLTVGLFIGALDWLLVNLTKLIFK